MGVVKYLDGILVKPNGTPEISKQVICVHEQDNGIGWKHTNWRTGRAVSTRRRELVIQYIITLANYEYIFNVSTHSHCYYTLIVAFPRCIMKTSRM